MLWEIGVFLCRHDVGSAITYFTVVENPEEWVPLTTEPFFVTTDKDVYDIDRNYTNHW